MSQADTLILLCRSGFEGECASEISDVVAAAGAYGYPKLEKGSGYVCFHIQGGDAVDLVSRIRFDDLIFTRQWFACLPGLVDLPPKDRLTPLAEQVAELPQCAEVVVETPDTTDGRELQGFGRKLASALAPYLRQHDLMLPRKSRAKYRLHLFILSGREMFVGVAPVNNSAALPGGIPRLKFPAAAPSRSTLKLEEAWHWFIPRDQWDTELAPGMRAVDLGAAPGGWTWQLVKRGMFVTAIDNGPMNEDLMETGQVEHLREDAFTYYPSKPVDWMVCDVVEKPARTTAMVIDWALNGRSRNMIFNLKLPMKQRYVEASRCLAQIREELDAAGIRGILRAKQLYHDREEITCWLSL
ncbi:23S rRNA (cytidine(2498)-2'-O)-methyltransferase RlmM [Marinobacterium mangrovicola]|uniref:Ribosomal RNA large subunit methyltransferase M n=1 Tax=Marinobacterium mangrovicola TaxID=1476959 RepID=A0A4V6ND27_9GAMM|nr:23S rRNA (cytidine(2498)-2'-O)-methyltransferase RlmM [Marinobacterium mangrovicola]TCK09486.1 23S rRNA (cytidine2498-2'-O)-methyltransferase [Marinobacterium mangrovicola]